MGRRGRKHFDKQGNMYFITTTVLDFEKIFQLSNRYYDILVESLKYQLNEHKSSLFAYVLMPNHIHLILHIPLGESITDFMRDFKRHTSIEIRKELEITGKTEIINRLKQKSGHGGFKLWMDRFDDVILTSDKVIQTKSDYIHNNPVRAGLVEKAIDWKHPSARNYFLGDQSVIKVGVWQPAVPGQVHI
jgi:putative transposase